MIQFAELRRRLARAGGSPADASTEAVRGRPDDPGYRPAQLVESPLRHIDVGDPTPWHDDVGFLDGTQHAELIGYVGTHPVLAARIGAAVRLRHDRRLRLAAESVQRVIVARPAALAVFGAAPAGYQCLALEADDEPHPVRDLDLARGMVDHARAAAELDVARRFRQHRRDTWLVLDGSLAVSPDLCRDPRAIGVVKSHAMLPFAGDELGIYLSLPRGQRTSLFAPAIRQVTPVHSWALRLREWAGRDLFHGLVRVEAPATDATRAMVDTISRYLLAERAPLANDSRADRLLYGIHDVERFLRARGA